MMTDRTAASRHVVFMQTALQEAESALNDRNYPCGCVIVQDGHILARGRNRVYSDMDVTRHAEMVALSNAIKKLNKSKILLSGASVYTTVAPCLMCTGALIEAGISEVIYGTQDKSEPTYCLQYQSSEDLGISSMRIEGGILYQEASHLLQNWYDYKAHILERVSGLDEKSTKNMLADESLSQAHLEAWLHTRR